MKTSGARLMGESDIWLEMPWRVIPNRQCIYLGSLTWDSGSWLQSGPNLVVAGIQKMSWHMGEYFHLSVSDNTNSLIKPELLNTFQEYDKIWSNLSVNQKEDTRNLTTIAHECFLLNQQGPWFIPGSRPPSSSWLPSCILCPLLEKHQNYCPYTVFLLFHPDKSLPQNHWGSLTRSPAS